MEENVPREKLIDIQNFIGLKEYTCIKCGCVNSWHKVAIDTIIFKNTKKPNYRPVCPDCESNGSFMLQSKVERIWWKGSMTDIASFDSKLLAWMLEKNYFGAKAPRIRECIITVLENRLFSPEVIKDIVMTGTESKMLTKMNDIRNDIRDHENIVSEVRQDLIDNSATLDYFEIQRLSKIVKTRTRRIESARKLLAKLTKEDQKRDEKI